MRHQSDAQKATVKRVMHEFKHGELRSAGSGEPVEDRNQAVAIAMHEAGSSREESSETNRQNLRRTKEKERHGQTAEAEKEGKAAQNETLYGRRHARSDRH